MPDDEKEFGMTKLGGNSFVSVCFSSRVRTVTTLTVTVQGSDGYESLD